MEEPTQETYEQGRADALRDIAEGRPKLFWGVRHPWAAFVEDLFRTRYGITIEPTGGFVWAGRLAYWEGYNTTLAAHLDSTHGVGTYRKAKEEVAQFRTDLYAKLMKKRSGSES